MSVIVNVYDGCGCGSGSNGGNGGSSGSASHGGNSAGDSDGFVYSGTPSNAVAVDACDIATTIAPYILDLCAQIVESVQQAVNGGDRVVDAIAELAGTNAIVSMSTVGASNILVEVVDVLTSILSNQPDNLIGALRSTELSREFQFASYQYLARNKSQVMPLTRGDLRGMVNALKSTTKAFWGSPTDDDFVVGLGLYLTGLVNVVNLNRINRDAAFAAGTGNTPICQYAAQQIGEGYTDRFGSLASGDSDFQSVSNGDYTIFYADVDLEYSNVLNADVSLPAQLGDISAVAFTTFQNAAGGSNIHRVTLDEVQIAPETQGLQGGIYVIGDSIAASHIVTNKNTLFAEQDAATTTVNFANAAETVAGIELRIDLTPDSNPNIVRTITRILVAVLND